MSEIINLPQPIREGKIPLEKAIAIRRSRRKFLPQPLSLEQISQLVWAAQGQDPDSRYRIVPSAGATYPLELFIVNAEGLFHYLHTGHALEKISGQDLRTELAAAALGQGFIEDASVTLIFTAEFARTTNRYGKRGVRYVYMEAGHAAQNVHLQAESLGLGSVAVGAFDDSSVSEVLTLPQNLEPVYMVTVGYYRK